MPEQTAGLAVLHGYDPDTGKVTTDTFHEREDQRSPWHAAHALRRSVEGDFPGWVWSVGQDQRSHYLMYAENMRRMGLDADPYDTWAAEQAGREESRG